MERRQFMKTAAAAAAVPLVPGAAFSAVHAEAYARAVKVAEGGAFLSAKFLEYYLRIDKGLSEAFVQRMTREGILGKSGMNGLMLSKSFFKEHAKIAAISAKIGPPGARGLDRSEVMKKARDVVLEEPEDEVEAELVEPDSEEELS